MHLPYLAPYIQRPLIGIGSLCQALATPVGVRRTPTQPQPGVPYMGQSPRLPDTVTEFLGDAREKAQDAPVSVSLELAAQALGITAESLRSLIEWHEQYMQWHDDDPDYRLL